jgi:hypothetical protein
VLIILSVLVSVLHAVRRREARCVRGDLRALPVLVLNEECARVRARTLRLRYNRIVLRVKSLEARHDVEASVETRNRFAVLRTGRGAVGESERERERERERARERETKRKRDTEGVTE